MNRNDCTILPLSGAKIDENGVPTEFRLLPLGQVETRDYGPFLADDAALSEIIRNFEDIGNELVIDYEHTTLTGGEAPAAGWISRLINKADGLWAEVKWTDKAAARIAAREYRYFSPVVLKRRGDNRAVALHSVGLTNSPNIKHLEALVNKSGKWEVASGKDTHSLLPTSHSPLNKAGMEFKASKPSKENAMLKKMIELLQLKAEATEAEVLAAVGELKTAKEPATRLPDMLLETLGLKAEATAAEVNGTILALKAGAAQGADLVSRITELESRLAKSAADELVTQALKAGKIAPAQQEWAAAYATKDPVGFTAYIAAAPVVVPLKSLPEGGGSSAPAGGLSPEMEKIRGMFGHSEDSLKACI